MIHRSTALLIAAVVTATLSGCGLWDAWKCRRGFDRPAQTTYNDGHAQRGHSGIQPGHSTDPLAPISPPPAPPARSDIPPSKPNQPLIEQDVRHQHSPQSDSTLIKTLKTPNLFTPEGVRSIYDRFRNADGEAVPETEKPSGPIAQNRIAESPTRPCQYTDAEESVSAPVRLGLPESDIEPPGDTAYAAGHSLDRDHTRLPTAMQANPSSFKHPLLADPTGVVYRTH